MQFNFGLVQTNWSGAKRFGSFKRTRHHNSPTPQFCHCALSTTLSGQKEVAKPFRIMKNKHIINLYGNRCCFCINYHINSRDAQLCENIYKVTFEFLKHSMNAEKNSTWAIITRS